MFSTVVGDQSLPQVNNNRGNLDALMNHPYNPRVPPAELGYSAQHQHQQQMHHHQQNHPQPAMSIRSLLAQQHDPIPWSPVPPDTASASPAKRKRIDEDPPASPYKLQRTSPPTINNVLVATSSSAAPPMPSFMTTLSCIHASVAQKSYGSEKRFLCPPPVVKLSTSDEGASAAWKGCHFTMSINPECTDHRSVSSIIASGGSQSSTSEQKAILDEENLSVNFKYLHVGGGTGAATKSKWFQLHLDVANPNPSTFTHSAQPPSHPHDPNSAPSQHIHQSQQPPPQTQPPTPPPAQTLLSLLSPPITIISKPSKKTARTRNIASSILSNSHVSLFNRINSQTVRTKYMCVDGGRVCAGGTGWCAFEVRVLQGPGVGGVVGAEQAMTSETSPTTSTLTTSPGSHPSSSPSTSTLPHIPSLAHHKLQHPQTPHPLHYGSVITLTDTSTGVSSDPLVIRKVDKGRVSFEDVGPISQMQKVALQRWVSASSTDTSSFGIAEESGIGPVEGQGAAETHEAIPSGRVYLSAANLTFTGAGNNATTNVENSPVLNSNLGQVSFSISSDPSQPTPVSPPRASTSANPSNTNPAVELKGGAPHPLSYHSPRLGTETKGDVTLEVDEVDDFLCWTLVGVAKFSYTFFDGNILSSNEPLDLQRGSRSNAPDLTSLSRPYPPPPTTLPTQLVTPFPTISSAMIPKYDADSQTLEMAVSDLFVPLPSSSLPGSVGHYPDEVATMEIWLGNLGPLRYMLPSHPHTMGGNGKAILPAPQGMMPMGGLVDKNAALILALPPLIDILRATGLSIASSSSPSSSAPPKKSLFAMDPESRERFLPILFVRPGDRIGYHSGRYIVAENAFHPASEMGTSSGLPASAHPPAFGYEMGGGIPGMVGMGIPGMGMGGEEWMKAAQAAAASTPDSALHGWTLRVQ